MPEGNTQNSSWTESLSAEDKAFVTTKGWTDPAAVIASYKAAESKLGVPAEQVVRWPTGDKPDLSPIYTRLGVPDSADKYAFDGISNETLVGDLRNIAFANKLTPAQALEVAKGLDAAAAARKAQADGQAALNAQAEDIKLRAAWGGDYDVLHERMMNQLNQLPWTPEQKALFTSTAQGKQEILKLAVLNGEAKAHGVNNPGNQSGNKALSPEEAKAELDRKMADPAWRKKYYEADKDAMVEFMNLTQLQVRR